MVANEPMLLEWHRAGLSVVAQGTRWTARSCGREFCWSHAWARDHRELRLWHGHSLRRVVRQVARLVKRRRGNLARVVYRKLRGPRGGGVSSGPGQKPAPRMGQGWARARRRAPALAAGTGRSSRAGQPRPKRRRCSCPPSCHLSALPGPPSRRRTPGSGRNKKEPNHTFLGVLLGGRERNTVSFAEARLETY